MTTTDTRPDTHDMVVVHRVFRREATLLPRLVAAVRPGDVARARRIAAHLRDYQHGLHDHHTGEDDLLWPVLLARVDLEADLVLRMERQHATVAATLDRVAAVLPAWTTRAGAADRDALVAALTAHRTALLEHLEDEEEQLLPVAEAYLSAAEWARLGERFAEQIPLPLQMLFLGAILEEATAAERSTLLGNLPAPARLVWRLAGRPWYAWHIGRIRSTMDCR